MNYNLQIYKLSNNDYTHMFINTSHLVLTSPNENHSLFSLGYHHFIDRTRSALVITDNIETKNSIYYVVNTFEPNISNYEDNINNMAKIYFKNSVESREFYKFWEMYFIFDLLDTENIKALCFNSCGEDQAIINYRNKFFEKTNKGDIIYKTYIPDIKADLLIVNNDKNNWNENENSYIKHLIDSVIKVIESQKSKGNLIIKINDTFTYPTIKLILLLSSMYEDSYIYKPYFSRPSDSEKFIICKNFSDKIDKKIVTNLKTILKSTYKDDYITDIFLDIVLPKSFLDIFKFTNIKFVNQQQILINNIIKYIRENNYFGDKYHKSVIQQQDATAWWITQFFPPSDNIFKINKSMFKKLIETTTIKNNLEKDKFCSQLI